MDPAPFQLCQVCDTRLGESQKPGRRMHVFRGLILLRFDPFNVNRRL